MKFFIFWSQIQTAAFSINENSHKATRDGLPGIRIKGKALFDKVGANAFIEAPDYGVGEKKKGEIIKALGVPACAQGIEVFFGRSSAGTFTTTGHVTPPGETESFEFVVLVESVEPIEFVGLVELPHPLPPLR